MRRGNLLDGIPDTLPEELFTPLTRGAGVRVERIVARGHALPPDFWYDLEELRPDQPSRCSPRLRAQYPRQLA